MKLNWLTDEARLFLQDGYLHPNETAEERYAFMAKYLGEKSGLEGFEEKVIKYIEKKWLSFASPEIANLGRKKGLPASCNFLKIQDTMESISSGEHEMSMLASNGAGTARNFSNIRAVGERYGVNGRSVGVMSWVESYAGKIKKVSQNGMRRGFLTVYLSVEHPEIVDFLQIGREGHSITNITTGVTYPKDWMESMLAGDKKKQKIFTEVHKSRSEIGYPYQLFEDNSNVGKHQMYIDKGMWLDSSNICTECVEWTDEFKEFLCVLASANLEHYDEWKNTDFIFDMNIILDIVIEDYIQKAKHLSGHEKSVKFAEEHRSIGVGVMAFSTYLQKKRVAFGSIMSMAINDDIFKYIRSESDRASKWMALHWGEPLMLKGYGDRNTSRIAIAPTKSSSAIMGFVSQGIEPIKSNYHTKDLAKIQIEWRNPQLKDVLQEYNKDIEDVWMSILENGGSVQHLGFMSVDDREVFKTSTEISQMDIIKLAGHRQKYIDQAQSINLTIPTGTKAKDVLKLTVEAWKLGLKTLYYQYSVNASREATKDILTCGSCEA